MNCLIACSQVNSTSHPSSPQMICEALVANLIVGTGTCQYAATYEIVVPINHRQLAHSCNSRREGTLEENMGLLFKRDHSQNIQVWLLTNFKG